MEARMADLKDDLDNDAFAKKAQEIVDQIAPLLFGHGSALQGNVIAMLMGMWLAGHHLVLKKGESEEARPKAERDLRAKLMVVQTHAAFTYAAHQEPTRGEKEAKP